MAFLLDQAKQKGTTEFTISLDRQSLADYLGVERSAMSAELSKLRADGILESKGGWFRLTEKMREQLVKDGSGSKIIIKENGIWH